jgi:serine/threonine protein kinase
VTDFGLARPLDGEATEITEPAVLIGTSSYLSPEQMAGRSVSWLCLLILLSEWTVCENRSERFLSGR